MATATDPCSQHTRASRRGGQIQTTSSQLIKASGLPNPRLPEPLSRNAADATPATGRDSEPIGEVSSPYNGECRAMTTLDAGVLRGTATQPDREIVLRETVHGPLPGMPQPAAAVSRSRRGARRGGASCCPHSRSRT